MGLGVEAVLWVLGDADVMVGKVGEERRVSAGAPAGVADRALGLTLKERQPSGLCGGEGGLAREVEVKLRGERAKGGGALERRNRLADSLEGEVGVVEDIRPEERPELLRVRSGLQPVHDFLARGVVHLNRVEDRAERLGFEGGGAARTARRHTGRRRYRSGTPGRRRGSGGWGSGGCQSDRRSRPHWWASLAAGLQRHDSDRGRRRRTAHWERRASGRRRGRSRGSPR